MKHELQRLACIAATLAALAPTAQAAELIGAGAALPAPTYVRWADAYFKESGNRINYQTIGSGSGVLQIRNKSVDFGASDIPLSVAELEKYGLAQFPTLLGGVVPIVNLPGITSGQVKLSGPVLADIYLGKITRWNDPQITRINSGVSLPEMAIAVIRRADGAGSTFVFSNYLSKQSPEWQKRIGEGTTVQWPVGLGGKGDEGVAKFVMRLPGAIGYVEYAYARQNNLNVMQMQNKSGNFVHASEQSFKAAASDPAWARSGFAEILTDQSAKDAWPITGATFVMVRRAPDKAVQAADILKFFEWSYKNGDKLAADSNYVALPDSVDTQVLEQWTQLKEMAQQRMAAAEPAK